MKINLSDKAKTMINWAILIGGSVACSIVGEKLTEKEARDRIDKYLEKNYGKH